ncbi:MAG: hypothetical protein K2R98_18555 [Gemmataceae bacterium]|nr:hypothetical protein [Gemmataceae bacterium]
MSLPSSNGKDYLDLRPTGRGLAIIGRAEHTDELLPLFEQGGTPCRRRADGIRFGRVVEKDDVEQVPESYKNAERS